MALEAPVVEAIDDFLHLDAVLLVVGLGGRAGGEGLEVCFQLVEALEAGTHEVWSHVNVKQ